MLPLILEFIQSAKLAPVYASGLFSRWYGSASSFALLACLGLAGYGFYTALAAQPIFGRAALEESSGRDARGPQRHRIAESESRRAATPGTVPH